MDWEIVFRDNGILEINCNGKFSNDDYLKMMEQVLRDSNWKPGMGIVADFREVAFEDMYFNDVFISVGMHTLYNELIGEGRIAAIHSSEEGFRLGKLYEAMSNLTLRSRISAFKNYDDAVDWIHS